MPSISVPTAIIGSSVLGAGASLIGGSQQAAAAKGAQNTQLAMFNQTQQNLAPYMAAGQQGVSGLEGLLGVAPSAPNEQATLANIKQGLSQWGGAPQIVNAINNGASLQSVQSSLNSLAATTTNPKNVAALQPIMQQATNPVMQQGAAPGSGDMMARLAQTPGYQFALQQGLQATQNGFAAQGLGQSGPALKGAAQYAQGLASTTYQQQVGNFAQLAGMGQNAAAGLGGLGQTAATQAGQFGTSGAAAGAAGLVGASNSLGGGAVNSALFGQLGMFGGSSGGTAQFPGGGVPQGVNITQSPAGFSSGYQWGP